MIAIIVALQSDWVVKAMRRPGWHRIGTFETRMYRDLKQFTANTDEFKFIRQAVESIVDVKPLETNSHSASVVSGGGTDSQSGKSKAGSETRPVIPSACIPFIGRFIISPLFSYSSLTSFLRHIPDATPTSQQASCRDRSNSTS